MQGAEPPSRAPLTLFTLTTPEVIKEYTYGCDADIGGTSSITILPVCLQIPLVVLVLARVMMSLAQLAFTAS
jgi:hypothetical protein